LGNSVRKVAEKYPSYQFFFTDVPEVDITNITLLEELVQQNNIQAIINCAAYTAVDKAETDIELAQKINVDGPRNLAMVAKKFGAKLIHISTDYVFNGNGNQPLKETDATDPIGAYGKTKLALAEFEIIYLNKLIAFAVLDFPPAFGPNITVVARVDSFPILSVCSL